MRPIVATTLAAICIAACATSAFVWALEPTSVGALAFFLVWMVLPYVVMGAVLWFLWRREAASVWHWCTGVLAVSMAGVLFMADAIFWHPDAQGVIAVLMIPVLQGIGFGVLLSVAWLASRGTRKVSSGT